MSDYFKKINQISVLIFIFIMIIALFLTKYTSVRISPLVLGGSLLLLVVLIIVGGIVSTIILLRELIRNKNSILITFYSLITFFSYKLSEVYTSNLLYESLGYNPKYLPHTSSLISIFPLIVTGLVLTATSLIILSFGSVLFISTVNSLIRPILFFLNLNKLEYINDKISDLGLVSLIIACILFCCVNFVVEINFNKLIQRAAIEFDYYPIRSSAFICDEAKTYEKFNYLSENVISVFRYDISNKKPIFSVINCDVI